MRLCHSRYPIAIFMSLSTPPLYIFSTLDHLQHSLSDSVDGPLLAAASIFERCNQY